MYEKIISIDTETTGFSDRDELLQELLTSYLDK